LPDITPKQVAQRMAASISGELTEATKPRFEHSADEQIPIKLVTVMVLANAITEGDVETFESTLKTEGDKMLYQTDYMGNSPIVSYFSRVIIPLIMLSVPQARRCCRAQ